MARRRATKHSSRISTARFATHRPQMPECFERQFHPAPAATTATRATTPRPWLGATIRSLAHFGEVSALTLASLERALTLEVPATSPLAKVRLQKKRRILPATTRPSSPAKPSTSPSRANQKTHRDPHPMIMHHRTPAVPALLSALLGLFLSLAPSAHAQPTPAPDLAKNPAPTRTPLNPALPTLFVAGDSTAARGRGERQQGWAEPFANYFDLSKINVANRARGGRSSRTFITEGLWDQLLADLKPGDFVLIQFGHNDASPVNEGASVPPAARRARGSIPGLGDETQAVDNIITKKPEVVYTFGWYLRKMIADTQARGATPVVLSLTIRNDWPAGKIERTSRHSQWSAQTATATGTAFFDLSAAVADQFEKLGAEKTAALYPQDHTHFNAAGADLHAATVVAGLKKLPALSLARFLK